MALNDKIIKHLKEREGVVHKVYLDTLNKPTAGVGHLLTPEELKLYKVGDRVAEAQVNMWLMQDMNKALNAAKKQAQELQVESEDFLVALVSVSFQLGTEWPKKWPTAYKHLKAKAYDRAIAEIKYVKEGSTQPSSWRIQTPVRVADFVSAIEALKK